MRTGGCDFGAFVTVVEVVPCDVGDYISLFSYSVLTDISAERKSMLGSKLLDMLRCPVDGSPLELVGDDGLAGINSAIEAGEVRDRLDQRISSPMHAGLLNPRANRVYPIRGGIPSLVADEAVDLPEDFFATEGGG